MKHDSELTHSSPWIKIPEIDWGGIIGDILPRRLLRGYILYMEHEDPGYVYLVKEGRISLSILHDEKGERIAFIADAGMMIGKLSAIDFLPNVCCAKIISEEAQVYFIPKKVFQEKMHTDSKFWQNVALAMAKTVRLLITQLKLVSFDDSLTRVCYAIIHMIQQYSQQTGEGNKITISFTHEQIGELTGLSRVSVSNVLSGLAKDGILQKKQGYYYIKKPKAVYDRIDKKEWEL